MLTAEEMLELDNSAAAQMSNADLEQCARLQADGLRNIANDPQTIAANSRAMYEFASYMQIRRKRSALYSIKLQPYFN